MKSILTAVLLLFSISGFTQSKNEITLGAGPSFFGWGDVIAGALTATYSRQLNGHFSIEPRIISSSGWKKEYLSYNSGEHFTEGYDYSQTSYWAAAASLVYTPFSRSADFLKLKSGFLLGGMAHFSGMDRTGGYPASYFDFGKELNKGLIHTVQLRFLNKANFFMGSEISMLTSFTDGYYNCDGFVWNFMGGLRF